jgi:glutathione S-transferase
MDYYDIAMRDPIAETCCSVNPWKARLALNFKAADYKTRWISLPDIPATRSALGVPPCRKHATGQEYPTLPVLVDNATGAKAGDSFDIAVYLQQQYPESGAGPLLPKDAHLKKVLEGYKFGQELAPWMPPLSDRHPDPQYDEYSHFNREVDLAFTTHVALMGYYLPLDTERTKQEFLRRAGLVSWDQFELKGEAREQMLQGFRKTLLELAEVFTMQAKGPFILGNTANYADLIVGGWLVMASRTLPEAEWAEVKTIGSGVFGRLFDALMKWAEVK